MPSKFRPPVPVPVSKVQLLLASSHTIVLSDAPFSVIPPPSAVVSVGVSTEPNSIFLSSTVTVVESIVVVVPSTTKLPQTVKSFAVPLTPMSTLPLKVVFWSEAIDIASVADELDASVAVEPVKIFNCPFASFEVPS